MGNFGKLFVVAKREYMERVRSRWFIVMTLLVPAIFSGAMLLPVYVAARSSASGSALRNIAILDASGAGLGEQIAATIKTDSTLGGGRTDSVAPRVIVTTTADLPAKERELQTQVEQPNNLVGYLVLTDSTLNGNSARYAGRNASTINDVDKLRTIVRQDVMIARLQHEGVRADVVKDIATTTFRLKSERITERGRSGSGTGGLLAGIIVGVLLFMSIVFHGQNVLGGVVEEKSSRVAEVVISSVKPEVLLAGKVLGVGAVGLTQQAAWLGISAYLLNFVTPILTKGLSGQAAAQAADQFGGGFATISVATIGLVLRLLRHRVRVLREPVRGGRLDGEQRTRSSAGGHPGAGSASLHVDDGQSDPAEPEQQAGRRVVVAAVVVADHRNLCASASRRSHRSRSAARSSSRFSAASARCGCRRGSTALEC